MDIIKSELQTSGEEEINIAVAKELDVPDPENAEKILALVGLTIEQYNCIDPDALKQIKAGIPIEELGRRPSKDLVWDTSKWTEEDWKQSRRYPPG